MAPNADEFCRQLTAYLGQVLELDTEFIGDIPWPERERRLDRGDIHGAWICGLPYVWKADSPHPTIELLVAPVMRADRYGGKPIYFSDVVVRSDGPFSSFEQLAGSRWVINEPRSHSGCGLTRYELARRGLNGSFFGQIAASGSHQVALQWILEGQADAAAIDSTVLETELERDGSLCRRIRVIETFGPSPIPPWVVSRHLSPLLKDRLKQGFLTCHQDPIGARILAEARVQRFVSVGDQDYDPIRRMSERAKEIEWPIELQGGSGLEH